MTCVYMCLYTICYYKSHTKLLQKKQTEIDLPFVNVFGGQSKLIFPLGKVKSATEKTSC